MELPLSRYQTISLQNSIQSSSSSFFSDNSNHSFFTGFKFSILNRKRVAPFSEIKCSRIEQNLRPKPKPKPKPGSKRSKLDEKTRVLEFGDGDSSTGLCDQIQMLVLWKKFYGALELFEILEIEGQLRVDSDTYDALINACISLKSVRGVKRVFNHMMDSDLGFDQYMRNRVLLMHVKCGMLSDARKLFDEMPMRNSVSWNTMIAGVVDGGDYIEAFRLFVMMWGDYGVGDSRTFATMIRASAGLGLMWPGKQLHSCAVKMEVSEDVFVACALIDMYSKCGSIEDAQFVFDELAVKTTVSWNTIIAGYALHGYSEEALGLYYEMQDSGVQMDHFTFSIVVRICARLGSLEHAKQAHAGLVRHGFSLDTVANTSLIDLYSKWGRIEDARHLFDKMRNKNVISWNALIAGYGNHGQGEKAVELFEKMLREGMKPNHVTLLAVLAACSYSGLSDHGWEIFDSMSKIHGINPRAMHYACMIELLGREGLLNEALELIKDAPFTPSLNMWAALLTACRVHHNLELGKFAAEKLYGNGPEKLGNYIVLLNIYNRMGKTEEANNVIDKLQEKGFKMLPACTWIDIKKQSYSFSSGDVADGDAKEIFEKLDNLLVEISKHGYIPGKKCLLPDVDEKEERMVFYHSEKLAVAFGLINTCENTPLQLVQSHRVCSDCHNALKLIAKVTGREIVVRDSSRFHRFREGSCSCGDYW